MRTTNQIGFDERATTPRAAAVAGIAFALLFATAMVLFQMAVPANPQVASSYTPTDLNLITWAVRVVPFAGIAFLWFIGAMRLRLGTSEDQFYATVMFASGVLFVAMVFVAFAFISGILAVSSTDEAAAATLPDGYLSNQSIAQQVFAIYALKMAAVFMASISALWRKTHVMPMPLAILTIILAAVLLITTSINTWMVLVFPAWVLIVSGYLLIAGLHHHPATSKPVHNEKGVSP